MIKLASISPKGVAIFRLMLSIVVGFYAMVSVGSASGLMPRGYGYEEFKNIAIDPRTISYGIALHQSEYRIQSFKSGIRK